MERFLVHVGVGSEIPQPRGKSYCDVSSRRCQLFRLDEAAASGQGRTVGGLCVYKSGGPAGLGAEPRIKGGNAFGIAAQR